MKQLGPGPMSTTDPAELAIKVTRTDGGTTLIGPIAFEHIAQQMVRSFELMAHNTTGADGAQYEVGPYAPEPGETYLPLVPADTDTVMSLMDDPVQGIEAPFPDLWSRLHAQHGYETARQVWHPATGMIDLLTKATEDEEDSPMNQSPPADDRNPVYPLVEIEYTVQFQTRKDPHVWWEAQANSTTDLAAAQDFSRRLMTGAERPRGNPKAFVTQTRIAQKVTTVTIVEGEGAPRAHDCDQLGHLRCSQHGRPE
ncbi:hypothetical protein [Streptomyces lydicus]|uniref:hypothetical protein n=1 Tax=Streptomyces lydicus TaxID=47763 RepID=UPI001011E51D|nr:hypothetical protein [Streptomyces lydicus]MCZ1012061.1 hypothetical protein [Streptomyces lydicus]